MRKCFYATMFLLVSASIALSIQTPQEWIKYTSAEGRYSVSLPAEPSLTTQEATAATGDKFPQYLAALEQSDVGFVIGYFDSLPGMVFSPDKARDGMVKRVNGTLLSETAISLGGYPGREVKVSTTPAPAPPAEGAKPAEAVEYIVRARFYEVDKRIYVLQIIFPKSLDGDAVSAKATKYFDSFQVVKN